MCLFGHRLNATEGLDHLAQHDQQFGLVAVFQNAVDHFQRERGAVATSTEKLAHWTDEPGVR